MNGEFKIKRLIFANDTFSNFHLSFLDLRRRRRCCLCVGAKIPPPVVSSFGRCCFLQFLITIWIQFVADPVFCHWLTTQGNQKKKKVLWGEKGRRFGRCFSFYTLSPNEENAHTEFSFQPKTEFQIKSKLKITDISLNQGLGTARWYTVGLTRSRNAE